MTEFKSEAFLMGNQILQKIVEVANVNFVKESGFEVDAFDECEGWDGYLSQDMCVHKTVKIRGMEKIVFKMKGTIHNANRAMVLAMIKEADVSTLAGKLLYWNTVSHISPFFEIITYASALPWPFYNRRFAVTERYGMLSDDSVVVLGIDVENKLDYFKGNSEVDGECVFSFYHIKEDQNNVILRRYICIELDINLPLSILVSSLEIQYKKDFLTLNDMAIKFPETMQRRMKEDKLYSILQ